MGPNPDFIVATATSPSRHQFVGLETIQGCTEPDGQRVAQYAADMRRGDKFPPIDLLATEDGTFYIVDGHHRVAAARLNEPTGTIEAEVFTCPDVDPARLKARPVITVAYDPPDWFETALDGLESKPREGA
jgi:hypothetical protein